MFSTVAKYEICCAMTLFPWWRTYVYDCHCTLKLHLFLSAVLAESMPKAYIRIIITPLNLYKRLFWPNHMLIILEGNEVKVCISHEEQGLTAKQI